MIRRKINDLDTPALIIDLDKMEKNLNAMQTLANKSRVKLRPHIKTHKSADIAKMQLYYGACGLTVAKISEAEAMAEHGINDIFIASQIVGKQKMERLLHLSRKINLRLAIDSLKHVEQLVSVFDNYSKVPVELMIEIDTGLNRCGVLPGREALELAREITKNYPQVIIRGIFTHEGTAYFAENVDDLRDIAHQAQSSLIETGKQIEKELEIDCEISIGCTIALLGGGILPGITEIRPGTYVFYDGQHASFIGHTNNCAATILSTVTSRRGSERIVADAGAKSLTIDKKEFGICKTTGHGVVKNHPNLLIKRLSDEHATIIPSGDLEVSNRIEIIPNHICPTVNLYDKAYGIRNGLVERVFSITARGCNQ